MLKNINKQISLSLTCVLILCVAAVLYSTAAQARRMNPDLMIKPPVESPATTNLPAKPAITPASQRVWQAKINDLATWQQLSKHSRDFEFSKFVIDIKSNKIYFADSNVFMLHADFVVDYLQKIPRTAENMRKYNQNYSTTKPQFILGYLTHYPQIKEGTQSQHNGLWTFSFWEGDTITPQDIGRTYEKLQQTFTIAPLVFRPDSSAQERVAKLLKTSKIATINNNQIYKSQPYQAFNNGQAIGRLVIVPAATKVESLSFAEDDIVLLQNSYPDISPVSGVITTQFSTPLSHVNLRAGAWGIPNATIKNAHNEFANLDGKQVFYDVSEAGYIMREATLIEVAEHTKVKAEKTSVVMPLADLNTTALLPLNQIKAIDATKYGAKTANLGEMMRAKLPMNVIDGFGVPLNIPDGFGVPFSYYMAHIKQHKINESMQIMLADTRFKTDNAWRKKSLSDLRKTIINAPIAPEMLDKISKQWQTQLGGRGVFVRSSTNAEDLKGFNGAGLYDTVPNVKEVAALETAIKQVWASIWNLRAVEERNYFGIDHNQVYPAVLIQTAINAAAAGVLLTTDIWGHQVGTYTINAKWGLGMRVVEGQKVAEQILFDTNNDGTRVISRSDETTMLIADKKGGMQEKPVPKGEAILTEKRAKQLAAAAMRVSKIFKNSNVLDIEWVLENRNGKDVFWIVQARPYVVKK